MHDEPDLSPLRPAIAAPDVARTSHVGRWLGGTALLGAALGGLLGFVAIAITVAGVGIVASNPQDSAIATVFGRDGIAKGDPVGLVLAWSVGPFAAALAGLVFAGRARRGVDGAGLWMGTATYVGAILLSPIIFLPDLVATGQGMREIGTSALQVPIIWMFAGGALAPLLIVCLLAGPIWAIVLRRVVGAGGRDGTGSVESMPIWPIFGIAILAGLGWVVATAMLNVASNATFD